MNKSRFDDIVRNRSYARVNAKIIQFRARVIEAIRELDPSIHPDFSPGVYDKNCHGWWPQTASKGDLGKILANVAKGLTFDALPAGERGDYPRLTWPRKLFDDEVAKVESELLATMDEMQKALCAPAPTPVMDGPEPIVETK